MAWWRYERWHRFSTNNPLEAGRPHHHSSLQCLHWHYDCLLLHRFIHFRWSSGVVRQKTCTFFFFFFFFFSWSTLGSPTHFTPASSGYQRPFFHLFPPSGYYNGSVFAFFFDTFSGVSVWCGGIRTDFVAGMVRCCLLTIRPPFRWEFNWAERWVTVVTLVRQKKNLLRLKGVWQRQEAMNLSSGRPSPFFK